MIIVISPSKTMVSHPSLNARGTLFPTLKEGLLTLLKRYSKADLQTLYQSSEAIADANVERFKHFKEIHTAIYSYTGAQYKALNVDTLTADEHLYLSKHLRIISGLYGLLRPFDTIGHYRLPMGVKWENKPLSAYWKKPLYEVLMKEEMLNLASDEYAQCLDKRLNVTNVVFYVDALKKKKAPAMRVKYLRGKMVRSAAEQKLNTINAFKTIEVDGFKYGASLSDKYTLCFLEHKKTK